MIEGKLRNQIYQFDSSSDGQLYQDAPSEAAWNTIIPERGVTFLILEAE